MGSVPPDRCLRRIDKCRRMLLIFAGYKPVVSPEVLKENICINIHYSLLPAYRGVHSTAWAILNDESYLGLTIHEINEYIDAGPIIHQYQVKNDFVSTFCDYLEGFNQYIELNLGRICKEGINGLLTPCV
ncbi:formyltransferase family protein [uncultured Sanguibacteroides sp.]|uniref:formyltransferase family protein n=1 Tax=uncultured Sanguibacteroides sp. TaxID=1635151 RepID=UPI0025EB521F|nr:formyltransferase family protein [uncultured Sanguibacteroides sp.]